MNPGEKYSMPQIFPTVPKENYESYKNFESMQERKEEVEKISHHTKLTSNQASYLYSLGESSKILGFKNKNTLGRYPSDFFTVDQIKILSHLFGFRLNSTLKENINFIRNRMGFPGIVDRDFFMTDEIDQILRCLKISTIDPIQIQKKEVQEKLNDVESSSRSILVPKSPRYNYRDNEM